MFEYFSSTLVHFSKQKIIFSKPQSIVFTQNSKIEVTEKYEYLVYRSVGFTVRQF